MRTADLPDVGVWLALSASEHPFHQSARSYWREAAAERMAYCRVTALGFVQLITNSVVMGGKPLSTQQAGNAYEMWLELDHVFFAPEPRRCDAAMADWARGGVIKPKGWTDAYLASFAKAAGFHPTGPDRRPTEPSSRRSVGRRNRSSSCRSLARLSSEGKARGGGISETQIAPGREPASRIPSPSLRHTW